MGEAQSGAEGRSSPRRAAPSTAFEGVPRRCGKPLDMRELGRSLKWRVEVGGQHERQAARVPPGPARESCPVCQSRAHQPFVEVFGFDYRQCETCGHLFIGNPPSADAIQSLYQSEDSLQAQVYLGEARFAERVERIARPKLAFCKEYLQPTGTWLDVGCGNGELLTAARDAGWAPLGIESDPSHVEFARGRGLQIVEGYSPSPALTADRNLTVLSALNVLEHQPEPGPWLRQLSEALPVGGHAVVEVPRHPSFSSFSCQLHPDLACRHIYPPDHLHIFSERSLELLLTSCRLQAVAVWVFGQDFQELMYSSAAAAGLPESPFFHQLLEVGPAAQRAIDEGNLSDVLLVVARKVPAPL